MITILVSIAAGGCAIGLLAAAVGLLLVRMATPAPTADLPAPTQIPFVSDALRDELESREAA